MRPLRFVLALAAALSALSGCSRGAAPPVSPATREAGAPSTCEPWVGSTNTPPAGLAYSHHFGHASPGAPAWRAPASDWHLPDGVTVEVNVSPPADGRIVLRAVLRNSTATAQELFLMTPRVGLNATLQGDGVTALPPSPAPAGITAPPQVLPESSLYVLPAGATWPFEATIDLRCWRHRSGQPARVLWRFETAGSGVSGERAVTLP
jgi:hypothetical protein